MAAACLFAGFCGPLLFLAAALERGEALGTLNLHELSELKYGIEIGAEPVMAGQVWLAGGPSLHDCRGGVGEKGQRLGKGRRGCTLAFPLRRHEESLVASERRARVGCVAAQPFQSIGPSLVEGSPDTLK